MPGDSLAGESSTKTRSEILVSALELKYLHKESGLIGILGRSSQKVRYISGNSSSGGYAAQSHNYYMLTSDLPVNYLHWLESDDIHILVEGGPLDYFIFHPGNANAKVEKITVGMDVEKGQRPVIAVPGGCWKALKLCEGVGYALTVNVLAPEFTEDRVKIGQGRTWVDKYVGQAEWVTETFLKELIGDNWTEEKAPQDRMP